MFQTKILKPLNLARLDTLCKLLGITNDELNSLTNSIDFSYVSKIQKKKSGKNRVLCKPNYKLKLVQKKIKSIISKIPLPISVHGWVKGRSISSAIKIHLGQRYVYCFDIHSYFDNVGNIRVYRLFNTKLNCSPKVSHYLTRLTTYGGCLPQGSPSSPTIANLVLFDFDISIEKICKRLNANYSRLGDDIIISSNMNIKKIETLISNNLRSHGLRINKNKTQSGQPSKSGISVLGIVLGSKVSTPRRYQREVKAILHNAQFTGLNTQNSEGRYYMRKHIKGRIAFIGLFDSALAKKFEAQLDRVKD